VELVLIIMTTLNDLCWRLRHLA